LFAAAVDGDTMQILGFPGFRGVPGLGGWTMAGSWHGPVGAVLADARGLGGAALATALREARDRSLAFTLELDDAQWRPPPGPGVNPFAWELAHIAWFAEFWTLRGPHRVDAQGRVHAAQAAHHAGPDEIFDSSRLAQTQRWSVALPTRAELAGRLGAQLEAGLESLARLDPADDAAMYFHRLALFHEDMHAEAFAWMRAALGLPAPAGLALPCGARGEPLRLPAGEAGIGWAAGRPGFAFDNERDARVLRFASIEIDAAPVTAGQFCSFVESGGYDEPAFWPGEAGAWRAKAGRSQPSRWRRTTDGGWQTRWFDRWQPLDPRQPVIHVNAWEAEAWCRWAQRRLPTAAEWERAAGQAPGRFSWGRSVWEWTADDFHPYPGFLPGPYRDYSAPWFGDHRELRGGAFATSERLHEACYRNFFEPHRDDVFAGFRSVACQG
jgi:ergothioneine biosynthesis protein EgtB